MKRIAMLGDSHAVALYYSLKEKKTLENNIIDFFCASRTSLRSHPMIIDDSGIQPMSAVLCSYFQRFSEGQKCIRFSNYDVLILVGWAAISSPIYKLVMGGFSPPQYYIKNKHQHLITSDLYETFLLQGSTWLSHITDRIRKHFMGDMFIIQMPFQADKGPISRHQQIVDSGYGVIKNLISDYWSLNHKYFSARNMKFVSQPDITVSSRGFTHHEYSVGSIALNTGDVLPDHEFNHMNSDYGKCVLEKLKKMLD